MNFIKSVLDNQGGRITGVRICEGLLYLLYKEESWRVVYRVDYDVFQSLLEGIDEYCGCPWGVNGRGHSPAPLPPITHHPRGIQRGQILDLSRLVINVFIGKVVILTVLVKDESEVTSCVQVFWLSVSQDAEVGVFAGGHVIWACGVIGGAI